MEVVTGWMLEFGGGWEDGSWRRVEERGWRLEEVVRGWRMSEG